MYHHNIRYLTISSRCLENNPMKNANQRILPVLLPDNYSDSAKYPTLWFLAGYMGSGHTLLNDVGPLGKSFGESLLEYQRAGILPPSICVFPDCSTRLGGSQYLDSLSCGPFMTHLVEELVPAIDHTFATIADASGRLITGHSSGGFGALTTAMLRPGIFGSVIASAADSAFHLQLARDFPTVAYTIAKSGGVLEFLDGVFRAKQPEKMSPPVFTTLMHLAMASCYSPAPDAPGAFGRLPVDLATGEIIPAVWQEWLAWDPLQMVHKYFDELKMLHYLHLDCGSEDEYAAQFGHRQLAKSLTQYGVVHRCTEFTGGHFGTNYRYRDRFESYGPVLRGLIRC
jgi:enterochelin esterase-like enzyme